MNLCDKVRQLENQINEKDKIIEELKEEIKIIKNELKEEKKRKFKKSKRYNGYDTSCKKRVSNWKSNYKI